MVYKATKVLLLQTGGATRGGRHDKVMAVLPRESNHIGSTGQTQSFRDFRFPLNWLVKSSREIQFLNLVGC